MTAQGEAVVAGVRTPLNIAELRDGMQQVYAELEGHAKRLEQHYRDLQDIEFTIERGKLWILQTREGKRPARAAVKIAVDLVTEGLITREEAVRRVEPDHVINLLLPRFDDREKDIAKKEGRLLAQGLNASPGAATGIVVFDPGEAERRGRSKEFVVPTRAKHSPKHSPGMTG